MKVFQTDLGAAKGLASELAKILLAERRRTSKGRPSRRSPRSARPYIDRLLAAYHDRTPTSTLIEPRETR